MDIKWPQEASSGLSKRVEPPTGVVLVNRPFPRVTWKDNKQNARSTVVRKHTLVGTADSADLVLDASTVSRIHAELEPVQEGLHVRDLESRNGTFIDGKRITDALIPHGTSAEVRLGVTPLEISYADGATAAVELWSSNVFHHLVGQSPAMRELFAMLARVAPTDASVLIRGETGTGKEVVARSIHEASHRREGPYVVVDCAALPEHLLDAELFGHARGAFTGAVAARIGAIEAAEGGTVFLDEIGELPLSMQPKLLRVLEQRMVRRIGESSYRDVNVRFVSATHRDLLAMVGRGEFREDLYFRMCVIPVNVPPLRSRREDIDLLVDRFTDGERLGPELMEAVRTHPWRGNVRELRNFVERARALGEQKVLQTLLAARDDDNALPVSLLRHDTTPAPRGKRHSGLPSLIEPGDRTEGTTPIEQDSGSDPALRESWPSFHPSGLPLPTPAPAAGASVGDVAFEGSFKTFRERWIQLGEREYLARMLARHANNVPALAKEAQVDASYIYRLMRKHGL